MDGLPEIGGSSVIDGSIVTGGIPENDAPTVTNGPEGTGRKGVNEATGGSVAKDGTSEGNTSDGKGRPDGTIVTLGSTLDGTGGSRVTAGGADNVGNGDNVTMDGTGGTAVRVGRGGKDGSGDKGAIDDGTIGGLLFGAREYMGVSVGIVKPDDIDDGDAETLLRGRRDGSGDGKLGGVHVGVGEIDKVGPSVNGGNDISGKVGTGGGERRGRRDVSGVADTEIMGGRPGPKSGLSEGSSEGSSDGSSEGSSDMGGMVSEGPLSSGEIPGYQETGRDRRPDRTATCTSCKQCSDKNAALRDVERNITWRKNVAGDMRSSEN